MKTDAKNLEKYVNQILFRNGEKNFLVEIKSPDFLIFKTHMTFLGQVLKTN